MVRRVRDYMSSSVETLTPESTMEEAVMLQVRRRIRHIPIVEGSKLVGILTDRDTKRAMPSLLTGTDRASHERVTQNTKVSQIMTRSPLTASPDAPLHEVVKTLVERKIGAVPVVEGGVVVGILTETDLLRALLEILEKEN